MNKKLLTAVLGLVVVGFIVLGYMLFRGKSQPQEASPSVRCDTDTFVVRDTIYIYTPAATAERPLRRDTVSLPTTSHEHIAATTDDTTSAHVVIPITQRVYADTSYRAVVSGFRPSLDTLEIYSTTRTVTHTVTRTVTKNNGLFGVGVQAGVGFTPKGVQPYIGVGVHISLWRSKQ